MRVKKDYHSQPPAKNRQNLSSGSLKAHMTVSSSLRLAGGWHETQKHLRHGKKISPCYWWCYLVSTHSPFLHHSPWRSHNTPGSTFIFLHRSLCSKPLSWDPDPHNLLPLHTSTWIAHGLILILPQRGPLQTVPLSHPSHLVPSKSHLDFCSFTSMCGFVFPINLLWPFLLFNTPSHHLTSLYHPLCSDYDKSLLTHLPDSKPCLC